MKKVVPLVHTPSSAFQTRTRWCTGKRGNVFQSSPRSAWADDVVDDDDDDDGCGVDDDDDDGCCETLGSSAFEVVDSFSGADVESRDWERDNEGPRFRLCVLL